MGPIKHILVVVDPLGGDRQIAVDKATILARCFHSSVELLICDVGLHGSHAVTGSSSVAEQTPTVQSDVLLERLAAPLRNDGLDVAIRIVLGDCLHTCILEYLRSSNATLVVKSAHHHSLARRTFLKNTNWYLAQGSHVPLLLTKDMAWSRIPRILAAIDPHPAKEGVAGLNRKILKCATELAAGLVADLHVVHAYVPVALAAAASTGSLPDTTEVARALECENSFVRAQLESFARACGVPPSSLHVEVGAPTPRLIDSARQLAIDVAIIGASSHGMWHRMFIGSTASAVTEFLPCDVLVVGR